MSLTNGSFSHRWRVDAGTLDTSGRRNSACRRRFSTACTARLPPQGTFGTLCVARHALSIPDVRVWTGPWTNSGSNTLGIDGLIGGARLGSQIAGGADVVSQLAMSVPNGTCEMTPKSCGISVAIRFEGSLHTTSDQWSPVSTLLGRPL